MSELRLKKQSRRSVRWITRVAVLCPLSLVIMIIFANSAMAWPNPSLVGSASTGTTPYSVCVQGGYAYVVNESSDTLQVFDVTTPALPLLKGSAGTGSSPASVCVQGGYAYVTNYGDNTMQVFDVSDPAFPLLVGSAVTRTTPYSLDVKGNFAYVVSYNSDTMEIFSISDPTKPILTGISNTGSRPQSISVQANYAYVVDSGSNTLEIFRIVNSTYAPQVSSISTGANPRSVCVQGGYAYVANVDSRILQVFNISKPAAPSLAGFISIGNNPRSVDVQGGYAYVANSSDNNIQVFNISKPAAPSLVTSVNTGSSPRSVCVQGSYAYVADSGSATLEVFCISDPAPPSLTGQAATRGGPLSVDVQGNYAYVINDSDSTLQVLNISNPFSPSSVGYVDSGDNPQSIYVQGIRAYVIHIGHDTMQVFDVSNPASPASAGLEDTDGSPQSICAEGIYAYVVNSLTGSLQIFNVSDPDSPVLSGHVDTGNRPMSVCVQGNYAYVVNEGSYLLQVFSIASPGSPKLVGSAGTGNWPRSVCVQGNYAYVVNSGSDSLQVFDVSDPTSPTLSGNVGTGDHPRSVCVQGGYACVANYRDNTMQVFDVSDPTSPTPVGSVGTGSWPETVRIQGGYAYVVSSGSSRLQVYSLWTRETPTLTTTAVTNISSTTADSGGEITDNGGDPVTARGVCWSEDADPTITDDHTTDGSGTGTFTSNITGLTPGAHYHVRAYATNSIGTSYGSDEEFSTLGAPIVTTGSASSIANTEAMLNGSITGNVTATGGENADERGFRYRKAGTATWAEWNQAGSFGVGSFSYQVTGLDPETKYEYQAWAKNSAGTSYGTVRNFTTSQLSPAPTPTPTTWYLAEGTSDYGFDSYITIENPNASEVTAEVTYMTKDGPETRPNVILPAMSQTVINPREDIGSTDFSTKVECKGGETIAVDRRMIWTGSGAPSQEGHCSIGVTEPDKIWYLPEGSSDWGFETWLLIQNPNSTEASCDITYMIEGKDPVTVNKKVASSSRASFSMFDDIGAEDASIRVMSDLGVIPERSMYRNNRREGHDSIGTTTPSQDYYLAEGCTGWGPNFTTYVLIQNPNDFKNNVSITYLTGEGEKEGPAIIMDPNSRKTIKVNDYLSADTDVSTFVHGDLPIIAERAMYWGEGTPLGEACHDSIGMNSPHTIFYLPDGEVGTSMETWTLVQNPNDEDVTVEISYLTPTGEGNVVFKETIPANSRKSFNMSDKGINGRAAVMVESLTKGKMIMCERSIYWNNRGAGTNTIGGYGD